MKKLLIICLLTTLVSFTSLGYKPDIWAEQRGDMPNFDLGGKKILMVVGHDYDHHEVYDIKAVWEGWGATVHVTAPESITEGHIISFNGVWFDSDMDSAIESDFLLSEAEMTGYDALYFPGGKGPEHLLQDHADDIRRLIDEALKLNLVIGAICGGPYALTAHEYFRGATMTVSPSKMTEMEAYGIDYINEKVVVGERLITANWPFFQSFSIAMAHKLLNPEDSLSDIFPPSGNDLFDFMQERRVPRGWKSDQVDEETLRQIVSVGMVVPWVNFMHQDWHFIAVNCPEKRSIIKDGVFVNIRDNNLHPNASDGQIRAFWNNTLDEPTLLLGFHKTGGDEVSPSLIRFMDQNIIAVGVQISLAANSLGIGTQWVSALPALSEPVSSVLETGDELRLVFAMVLGYPREYALPYTRRSLDQVLEVF